MLKETKLYFNGELVYTIESNGCYEEYQANRVMAEADLSEKGIFISDCTEEDVYED